MNKVFVRIHPKASALRFFRCGMEFTKEWPKDAIEVDAATEKRLKEEQMLEVVQEPSFAEYLVALAAQISERAGTSDAPATDAAAPDAGTSDAPAADAAAPGAGASDAPAADAAAPGAGASDAPAADAAAPGAGASDAPAADAAAPGAGASDAPAADAAAPGVDASSTATSGTKRNGRK